MSEQKFRFKQSEIGLFKDARSITDLLEPGCRIIGLTDGRFSLIDLIYHILLKVGRSNITLCTWSAGIKDAYQVKWMLDTDLIESFLLVTDHSYATRQKKYALSLSTLFGNENIRTSEIHAKFTLIQNENWNICIRHSMNLNANRTCESFEIDDDNQIYDFYDNFIKHTFSGMPDGFEGCNWKASDSIKAFFDEDPVPDKWSKVGKWE